MNLIKPLNTYSAVPPNLHIQGSSNTPNELDTLTLKCNITANPPANVTWFFRTTNGVKNVLSTSRRSISHHYEANDSDGPIFQSILIVKEVDRSDSGIYSCEMVNEFSTETVSVNFSVNVTGELALCKIYVLCGIAVSCLTILFLSAVNNECKIDNPPCQNGGICYDHLKGYTCTCLGITKASIVKKKV